MPCRSIGYSEECLGLHMGQLHDANLGDGDGRKTELFLARQYYFPVWGTCWESVAGLSLCRQRCSTSNLHNCRGASLPSLEAERHLG